MARLSTTPIQFQRTTLPDTVRLQTSGRAGRVVPIDYIPVLREDSILGDVDVVMKLAPMPRPLLNGVVLSLQAWFVPKPCHPQFASEFEFEAAYDGKKISTLGRPPQDPPPLYRKPSTPAQRTALLGSTFYRTLGIHVPEGDDVNLDLIDAFTVVYNHRLSAYSSKIDRRPYFGEDGVTMEQATALPRAFWPSYRNQRMVPDYESALITGNLELKLLAGELPLTGSAPVTGITSSTQNVGNGAANFAADTSAIRITGSSGTPSLTFTRKSGGAVDIAADLSAIRAELAGGGMTLSLAELDKARETQAFARFRQAYAGHDFDQFVNSEMFVHALMQGFRVDPEAFKRPILLDQATAPVIFSERPATDGPSLDMSTSKGAAAARLRLVVPQQPYGGTIIITAELCPERTDERMSDPWLSITKVSELPDALRDSLNPEPVDVVKNSRIDAKHTAPQAGYGFEPLNDKWNRDFTRLGGSFYQDTPGVPATEQRSALWLANIVDPTFTQDHFLVPENLPHSVFSLTAPTDDAFEATIRRSVSRVGLTQIGDVLLEDNNEYEEVQNEAV